MGVREACGIFGVYSERKGYRAAETVYNGLISLQHRGQESAGIATFSNGKLHLHRGMGLVYDVFKGETLEKLPGMAGVGHVRYSTTGSSVIENAQPFHVYAPGMELAISFNGNITNYAEMKEKLMKGGNTFVTTTDTELIGALFSNEYAKRKDIFETMKAVMGQLDGSYCLAILTSAGHMILARDPKGFKPLSMGRLDGGWAFSSETCGLDAAGIEPERDIAPGEVVLVKDGKAEGRRLFNEKRTAHCMFEFVYFARGDSVIEGIPVYGAREKLGEILARLYPAKADCVVPVPDSGRSFAAGYARASRMPFKEGLMKNRYIHRTFILPSQELRDSAVRAKLNPVKGIVAGKSVVLLEDSIVRGTTMKKIVKLLKQAGAKEVHLRVGCPPIKSPCYMGIDFPTYMELVAANHSVEKIREIIGADSLGYMTIEGLVEGIGLGKDRLCMACLTGEYPLKQKPGKETRVKCC